LEIIRLTLQQLLMINNSDFAIWYGRNFGKC